MSRYIVIAGSLHVRDVQFNPKTDSEWDNEGWIDIKNPNLVVGIFEAASKEEALWAARESAEMDENASIYAYKIEE
jgi:hypothetical protein